MGCHPVAVLHIYTQIIHRTKQNKQYTEQHNNWMSADGVPFWLVIPWHLPYKRGKITEKTRSKNNKNSKISNFMKILSVGADLHADKRREKHD